MGRLLYFGLTLSMMFSTNAAVADTLGDAAEGQKQFRQCASCHMIGEDARNRVGPVLNGIFGAKAASVPDFRYSAALVAAGEENRIWDEASLDAFLADPRGYLPGNRMSFRGLSKAEDRQNMIAYLRSISDEGTDAVVEAGFAVSDDVLSIVGDVEYGEYLSSECKTCHQASGGDDGIPNIVGLDTEAFVTSMHAYRAKFRDNQVMQLIAGRLDDEEIAALAAYFGDLEN